MRARNKHRKEPLRPRAKEAVKLVPVDVGQRREPRQRRPHIAVERWRDPPYAAASIPQLSLLARGVLDQAVWRVRDNGMNARRGLRGQPVEAIRVMEHSPAEPEPPPELYDSTSGSCRHGHRSLYCGTLWAVAAESDRKMAPHHVAVEPA